MQSRPPEGSADAFKELKLRQFVTQLDYISPALGLNYVPSPLLRYSYPAATPQIVGRIARTLLSHPRFYTQVLHLMNKMSLPVPFESFGPFEDISNSLDIRIPQINTEKSSTNDLSSDESELEVSDTEDNGLKPESSAIKPIRKVRKRLKTGFVGEKAVDLPEMFEPKRKLITKPNEVLPKIFDIQSICDQKTSICVNIVSDRQKLSQKSKSNANESTVQSSDFGLISAETQKQSEGMADEIVWDFNDVISDDELASNRISSSKWPQYKVFRNYTAGQVSVRLYLKNIDKSVDTKDLMRIYTKFIDCNSEEHRNMFDIRLMKTGRMKGQAFITLPDERTAQKALKETNGYLFNEKPIVVSYARSNKPAKNNQDH